jgi:hypothetical protein
MCIRLELFILCFLIAPLCFVTLSASTDSMNLNTVFEIFRFPPMKAPAGACLGKFQGKKQKNNQAAQAIEQSKGFGFGGGINQGQAGEPVQGF